jgi:Sortilin, neurotensin receptor 3, C-terminal
LEKPTYIKACECTDMDYECDIGYERTPDQRCVLIEGLPESKAGVLTKEQISQC